MKAVRAEGQEVIEKLLRHSPPRATLLLSIWMLTDIKNTVYIRITRPQENIAN